MPLVPRFMYEVIFREGPSKKIVELRNSEVIKTLICNLIGVNLAIKARNFVIK